MRQIVLDTETTGFDPFKGDRLVEIGCVEMINRQLTGNNYHVYINPERDVPEEVVKIHGLTTEFLQDKPIFSEVVDDFLAFVQDAELIIHNAEFDMRFLNYEVEHLGLAMTQAKVLDSLLLAREKYPGQRNTLDALCSRLNVNNSNRVLHGALLDAELLAYVYLQMTGGQTGMLLDMAEPENLSDASSSSVLAELAIVVQLPVIQATSAELSAHETYLQMLQKKAGHCLWAI